MTVNIHVHQAASRHDQTAEGVETEKFLDLAVLFRSEKLMKSLLRDGRRHPVCMRKRLLSKLPPPHATARVLGEKH